MKRAIIAIAAALLLLQVTALCTPEWQEAGKLNGKDIKGIQSGAGLIMLLKNDHTLWALPDSFITGVGSPQRDLAPSDKVFLLDSEVEGFSLSGNAALYIKHGTLYMRMFTDTVENSLSDKPQKVMEGVRQCDVGGGPADLFFLAVKSDNTLWGWGSNRMGQLGNGKQSEFESSPVKIADNVVNACAGADDTLFVKSDGQLLGCGNNAGFKLSQEVGTDVITQPVKLLDGVAAASASDALMAAVKTDGRLYIWGVDSTGSGMGFQPSEIMDNVVSVSAHDSGYNIKRKDGGLYFLPLVSLMGSKTSESQNISTILKKIADNAVCYSSKGMINYYVNPDGSVDAWWYDMANNDIILKNIIKAQPAAKTVDGGKLTVAFAVAAAALVLAGAAAGLLKRRKKQQEGNRE